MAVTVNPPTVERFARIVPPAAVQTTLPPDRLLDSSNAGVIVAKSGQARSEFRNEARIFARQMAQHVNSHQEGRASCFVYEESFGYEDRLHCLFHLRSLDTYYDLVEMGARDRAYRASIHAERVADDGGSKLWDRLFVDGTLRSTVMVPSDWGLPEPGGTPTAAAPSSQPPGRQLTTATAGIVVHRVALLRSSARADGRRFARKWVDTMNGELAGSVTALLYEEILGSADRAHWLIHLRDLTSHRDLARLEREVLDPGSVFVDGSVVEVSLTPHCWGLYGTDEASTRGDQ